MFRKNINISFCITFSCCLQYCQILFVGKEIDCDYRHRHVNRTYLHPEKKKRLNTML